MSIRYKFRSSAKFDIWEIESRDSVSVRDLRERIIGAKNSLRLQLGFDLVFYNADTELEYKGDDSQIPSGSSVIVKRIPAETLPSVVSPVEAVKVTEVKNSNTLNPANGPRTKFGIDVCIMPDTELPQFDREVDANNFIGNEKEDIIGLRLECPKLESSNIYQAVPKDCNQAGNGINIVLENRVIEPMKLDKLPTSDFPGLQRTTLPLELECPLCNTFFKDAVMIPCCQHSFCEKCIKVALTENEFCPKCFSSKCNVKNLLPNLTLRRAVERLIESQMHDTHLEKAMQKYVPDGESRIQGMEVSCAFYVAQEETELPQSSSASGKGSNRVFMEYYDQHHRRKVPCGGFGNRDINAGLPSCQINGVKGGDRGFSALGVHKKGVRNCYICGSPDHLMRDCPVSNHNAMFQPGNEGFHGGMPGNVPTYWNAPFRSSANMYGNPFATMMPFHAALPVSLFPVPPYVPTMCGGMSGLGNMRPPHHSNYFGLQRCESSRKLSNDNLERGQLFERKDDSRECHHRNSPEKSLEHRLLKNCKDRSLSYSGDSLSERSGRKSRHDRDKKHHAERSHMGTKEIPSSSDRHRDERHTHHYREPKKHHERRGNHGSESNLGNHSTEKDVNRRIGFEARVFHRKYRMYSESSFGPRLPVDWKRDHKERDICHDSGHSGRTAKRLREKQNDGRWRMVSCSDKNGRDENRHGKRKRVC